MLSVSMCQVMHSQPSHSVVAAVSAMELSKVQQVGLGTRSMLADFGMCADGVVRTDSSSGVEVGSRRGPGRLRDV